MLSVDGQAILVHAVLVVLDEAGVALAGDGDIAIARMGVGARLGKKRDPLGRFRTGDGVEQAVRVASSSQVGQFAGHKLEGVFGLGAVALDAEHCVWQRRSIRCRAERGHEASRVFRVFRVYAIHSK